MPHKQQITSPNSAAGHLRLGLLACLALSIGCSASVNVKRLGQVNRVAIIGYSLQKETKDDDGMMALVKVAQKAASGDFFGSGQAAYGYALLRRDMAKDTGWVILPQEEVKNNEVYKKLLEKHSGAMSALAKVGGQATPEGILNPNAAHGLSGEERRQLMASLKVDAVMYVGSRITPLESFSLGPVEWTRYKSMAWIYAYDGQSNDAIWQDNGANGESTKSIVTYDLPHVGEVGEDPEPMLMKALELSYKALMRRYQEAKKKGS
ncbi:hypothetical protein KKF91_01095 [Myxococcota bacterium]|nr:hypothetical protein [Myxococcota bacterium]MBU1429131.1 hypothetical protein [Myxococcota bacterium]MBU1900291.1 hypothetical protein [Myxococcota bacterium]